jgi:tRNA(adenine34) deaminase
MEKHESNLACMQEALRLANQAKDCSEVPVGAVVVRDSMIIGTGFNQNIAMHSVTAHAEMNAINEASKFLKNYRLINCDIYVTLEPCHMCAKAIIDARIKNLYFATPEPKSGAVISIDNLLDKNFLNHRVRYHHGLLQQESSELLKNFFSARRG